MEHLKLKGFVNLSSLELHFLGSHDGLVRIPTTLRHLTILKTDISPSNFVTYLDSDSRSPKLETLHLVFPDDGTPPHPISSYIQEKTATAGDWALNKRGKLVTAARRRGVELQLESGWTKMWARRAAMRGKPKKWVLVSAEDAREGD
jgi:hypothetical protein